MDLRDGLAARVTWLRKAGLVHATAAHERDTDVELRVARPLRSTLPVLKFRNGHVIFTSVDEYLSIEHQGLAL